MVADGGMSQDLIDGASGPWEVVIGLEVHAQVVSASKLFSGAATAFGAEPNAQVSLVDAAFPGMLPVINRVCVEQAVRTGLGLNAKINKRSIFDRKNYFYPDLPAGYQISQYKNPIVGEGVLLLDLEDGGRREIGIERLHLEQDAGKSIHDRHPRQTYVDLNRAGVALMEIVSKPDLRSAAEAGAYLRKLRAILRYLGTCDGNMEEGSMRADVNVSVRRPGEPLGTRTETKNVNSIRFVQQAIQYEARRQVELIEGGGAVVQETRLFDPDAGRTRQMRSKEEAHDYRYFPDPDLLPLLLEDGLIERLRAELPELPDQKQQRYQAELGLSAYDAGVLVVEKESAEFFEAVAAGRDAKVAANWVMGDFFGQLNRADLEVSESPITAAQLGGLLDLVADGTLSGSLAKQVFQKMFQSGRDAEAVVEEEGLRQVSDAGEIEALVERIVAENPDKADEVRAGKAKLLGWFVGQVMKASGGKANPKLVNQALRTRLFDE
jgi:aspartyl-tRNA(Asn)/glutamyl-tRNA(Gln) amidotransferase subunit B